MVGLASDVSQSSEPIGTETKPQKKDKRSLRQDFDSCSTRQGLQYQDASKMECPSTVSTPYASLRKKITCLQQNQVHLTKVSFPSNYS